MESLKDYILNKLDQADIFAKYFTIPVADIHDSIEGKLKISNPLRDDPRPSLVFRQYKNKIVARDYGNPFYSGDIFDVVGYILNKNSRNPKDFVDICSDIINNNYKSTSKKETIHVYKTHEPIDIRVDDRIWNYKDFRYFWRYSLPKDIIKESYIPVKHFYLDDYRTNYKYSPDDPCYAYINNPGRIKLCFPFRSKSDVRFISNNKIPLELIHKLTKKDYTILIKAYKDKLLLEYVCYLLKIDNIQFVSVASESARLDIDLIMLLRKYTNKKIFTMFDMDTCGFESSYYYRDEYGFENIFLGRDYNRKDPTDLVNLIKLQAFLLMFKKIYECF